MFTKGVILFCTIFLVGKIIADDSSVDIEKRRTELLLVLDDELREIARLNKQNEFKRPDLLLRMGQGLLEKGRLLKDRENLKYLSIKEAERSKIKKSDFFKDSSRYFEQAQKTIAVLIKKFPNFKDRSDAFYILAYNAKEFQDDEKAKKYFSAALKSAPKDSSIANKSRLALAEIYYNKGYFDKALPLYEESIKNKNDRWWTKDAFNLAWCYFKNGKSEKAISQMHEALELSKNSQYIDMTSSIERDLALFYTEAGRQDEAITFFKKNGKNITEMMLKVGKHLKAQGKFAAAEKILLDSLTFKKNDEIEMDAMVELVSLYDKFNRPEELTSILNKLMPYFLAGKLSKDQLENVKYATRKQAAILEKNILTNSSEKESLSKSERLKLAAVDANLFIMSSKFNTQTTAEDLFHAGEVYFVIENYDEAIKNYDLARIASTGTTTKNDKIEQLAINAELVTLGKKISKETEEKYVDIAFYAYLKNNPKGDKASSAYQRLFTSQVANNHLSDAENTLASYQKNFGSESDTQEKMIATLMDKYKEKKDIQNFSRWVDKINKKEVKVSAGYLESIKAVTLSMQFESVEKANSSGNKIEALKGYLKIYKSPDSTEEARRMAAYNIAVIFYDVGDSKQLFTWGNHSASLLKPEEVKKFEKDYVLMTTDLFQRRKFSESAKLSEVVFDKLCELNSDNKKTFFRNAIVVNLADKKIEKAIEIINKNKKCKIPEEVVSQSYLDILNELSLSNRWSLFNDVMLNIENNKNLWPNLIYPMSLISDELDSMGKNEISAKIKKKIAEIYDYCKKNKKDYPVEAADAIAKNQLSNLETLFKNYSDINVEFPESVFNKNLKQKLSMLDRITTDAVNIADIGSGIGTVKAYKIVVMSHEQLISLISNVKIENKSAEYVTSFRKSMEKLLAPLRKQCLEFRSVATKRIESDGILVSENKWFYNKQDQFDVKQMLKLDIAVMDKAGLR